MDSIDSILQLKLFPFPGSKTVEPRGIRGICPLLMKTGGNMPQPLSRYGWGAEKFLKTEHLSRQKWNLPSMKKNICSPPKKCQGGGAEQFLGETENKFTPKNEFYP